MARLGSEKRPLVLRVQDPDRGREGSERCEEIGARFIVGIEPRSKTHGTIDSYKGEPYAK